VVPNKQKRSDSTLATSAILHYNRRKIQNIPTHFTWCDGDHIIL